MLGRSSTWLHRRDAAPFSFLLFVGVRLCLRLSVYIIIVHEKQVHDHPTVSCRPCTWISYIGGNSTYSISARSSIREIAKRKPISAKMIKQLIGSTVRASRLVGSRHLGAGTARPFSGVVGGSNVDSMLEKGKSGAEFVVSGLDDQFCCQIYAHKVKASVARDEEWRALRLHSTHVPFFWCFVLSLVIKHFRTRKHNVGIVFATF